MLGVTSPLGSPPLRCAHLPVAGPAPQAVLSLVNHSTRAAWNIFLEVNAKGSPEVSQKPVFGDPKITGPADGGEKRQPAAHKHLICPCGTLDQRSARAGQNTARDAPPPPRPAPRARGTAQLRVSLPSPGGGRKGGGRAGEKVRKEVKAGRLEKVRRL